MSRVSYFQRFSQPENHATNNTLLAFRFFYQTSPFSLQRVLVSLLEADISIGLTFEQQVRGSESIPDALISQESFKIFIETKRGGTFDADQMRRHILTIKNAGSTTGSVLLGITKEPIAQNERQSMSELARNEGITFAAVTFAQIVESLREHEGDLVSIVDDYESYLTSEGLLAERNQWLIVVPCGTSINENVEFGLYYEPVTRPCKRNYRFLGLYTQKAVAFIGTIQSIATVAYKSDGTPDISAEEGPVSDEQRELIKRAVEETPYYDLKDTPHRFYLVDKFIPFGLRKASPGGIMGLRYLDLSKISDTYNPRINYDSAQVVELLSGRSWE